MTSVESVSQQRHFTSTSPLNMTMSEEQDPHGEDSSNQQQRKQQKQPRTSMSPLQLQPQGPISATSPSVTTPRFEAYTMTGNVILAKTNNRHPPSGSGGKNSSAKNSPSHKPAVVSPRNIVLHSPVLANRKSFSPDKQNGDNTPDGRHSGLHEDSAKDYSITSFEISGHDFHGFRLTTTTEPKNVITAGVDENKEPETPQPSLPITHPEHTSAQQQLIPSTHPQNKHHRSATPEIVDDRPVWTINAPVQVSALHSKSLPASPSARRSAQRYREVLKEETIITDTTISEVTDTNTSTTYILPSPRTPHSSSQRRTFESQSQVSSSSPQKSVADEQAESEEEESELERVVLRNPSPDVEVSNISVVSVDEIPPMEVRKDEFVHPESAVACMDVFPLEGLRLDEALRVFLKEVKLIGETLARQRVIDLFAMRFVHCNPKDYYDRDTANAAVSAMLILNSDLYSQHRPHNPTNLPNFVARLREIPQCDTIPDEELKRLYQSIKNEQLPLGRGQEEEPKRSAEDAAEQRTVASRSGYLTRKCCVDHGGKLTRFGRRGWHKFYVIIHDMVLELYKKEPLKESDECIATIPLHHGYALIATDYRKRPFVLRFRAVDESVMLFQAMSQDDLTAWVIAINRTAALFSAPVSLPVGSQTMGPARDRMATSVRPLYPSKKSGLTIDEQLTELTQSADRLQHEIAAINTHQPESRAEAIFMSAQLSSYKHELERCRVYFDVLSHS